MTHTIQQRSANSYLNDSDLVRWDVPDYIPAPLVMPQIPEHRPWPTRYPKSFGPALLEAIRQWQSKPFGALVFEAGDCFGYINFHGKLLAKIHKATMTVVQVNIPSENSNLARFHLRKIKVHAFRKNRREWLCIGCEKVGIELDKNIYLWPESTPAITIPDFGPEQLRLPLPLLDNRLLIGLASDNGISNIRVIGNNNTDYNGNWVIYSSATTPMLINSGAVSAVTVNSN